MEKKLRSLCANVSSNQKQADELFTADDFFSKDAVIPFNDTIKVLNWGGIIGEITSKEEIYEFTKTLYFKDYFTQKQFYDTFSTKLTEHILKLKAEGNYTGQLLIKEYQAEVTRRIPFLIGKNKPYSSFGGHGYAEVANCRTQKEKIFEDEIRERIITNLSDKNAQKIFRNVDDYVKHWRAKVPDMLAVQRSEYDKTIKEYRELIEGQRARIAEYNHLATQVATLNDYNEKTDAISQNERQIQSLAVKVSEYAIAGNMDEMNRVSQEIQTLKGTVDQLKESLKDPVYESIIANQYDVLRATRNISAAEENIERHSARIAKLEEEYSEQVTVSQLLLNWMDMIGVMFEYNRLEESEDWDYDKGTEKWAYTEGTTQPVVLAGVSFKGFDYESFTLGRIELKLVAPTYQITQTLPAMVGKIKPEHEAQGRKHTVTLEKLFDNYSGNWNKHIGAIDTSRIDEKVILTGNLLKLFNATRGAYSGAIIKYDTKPDEKGRVSIKTGIELTDKSAKELVLLFDNIYNIYFDLNRENYQRLAINHYEYLKEQQTENLSDYGVSHQIDTGDAKKKTFVRYINDPTKWSGDNEMIVSIESEDIRHTEMFARMLKNNGIADYRYCTSQWGTVTSKVAEVDLLQESFSSLYQRRAPMNVLVWLTSPGAKADYQDRYNGGFTGKYAIRMTPEVFLELLDKMEATRRLVTCATSSDVVERNNDFYIFGAHSDEIDEQAEVDVPDYTEMSVDELVLELINSLNAA